MIRYLVKTVIVMLFLVPQLSAQGSYEGQTLSVEENQIFLILTEGKKYTLESGTYTINEKFKQIIFEKNSSLNIKEFDVLDSDNNILLCKVSAEYSLVPENVLNISNKLEWIHNIKTYKKLLLEQEIRVGIRKLAQDLSNEDLNMEEPENKEVFEKRIKDILKDYVDSISIKLSFN
ncbi:MAG: hypothetical protein RIC95_03150 [Vicingaceae bacterium]